MPAIQEIARAFRNLDENLEEHSGLDLQDLADAMETIGLQEQETGSAPPARTVIEHQHHSEREPLDLRDCNPYGSRIGTDEEHPAAFTSNENPLSPENLAREHRTRMEPEPRHSPRSQRFEFLTDEPIPPTEPDAARDYGEHDELEERMDRLQASMSDYHQDLRREHSRLREDGHPRTIDPGFDTGEAAREVGWESRTITIPSPINATRILDFAQSGNRKAFKHIVKVLRFAGTVSGGNQDDSIRMLESGFKRMV